MEYGVILLDADGTLFDYDRAEEYALKKALVFFLKDYKEDYLKVYRKINAQIWREFEEGTLKAQAINRERFKRYFKKINRPVDLIPFSQLYMENLKEASFLIDGAWELLMALQDFKLVLVTNGLWEIQHSRLEKASLKPFFSSLIISQEVGVAKPHQGIFSKALASIGHQEKGSVLMVGDSLSSDIRGGVEFGIDTCWFNPKGEENRTPYQSTYEIKALLDLLDILL